MTRKKKRPAKDSEHTPDETKPGKTGEEKPKAEERTTPATDQPAPAAATSR